MPPVTSREAKHFAAHMEGSAGSQHKGLRGKAISYAFCPSCALAPPGTCMTTACKPRETKSLQEKPAAAFGCLV